MKERTISEIVKDRTVERLMQREDVGDLVNDLSGNQGVGVYEVQRMLQRGMLQRGMLDDMLINPFSQGRHRHQVATILELIMVAP